MSSEKVQGLIDELCSLSSRLRDRVGKPDVSNGLRCLLEMLFASSQEQMLIGLEKLSLIFKATSISPAFAVSPSELILELKRSARLSGTSSLTVGLNKSFAYYYDDLFSTRKKKACFNLRFRDMLIGRSKDPVSFIDALFYACLIHELGTTCESCLAFPVAIELNTYGWILVSEEPAAIQPDDWPDIPSAKGVFQTRTRVHRRWLADKNKPLKNMAILLESGIQTPNSLYLSDPVLPGNLSVEELLSLAKRYWQIISGLTGDDSRKRKGTHAEAKMSAIYPQHVVTEEGLNVCECCHKLADDLEHERKYELPKLSLSKDVISLKTSAPLLGDSLWATIREVLGWKTAIRLKPDSSGQWNCGPYHEGEELLPRHVGAVKNAEYSAKALFNEIGHQLSSREDKKYRIVTGGYLQGWACALAIPSCLFNEWESPEIIVLLTDRSERWARQSAKVVIAQLEEAIKKTIPSKLAIRRQSVFEKLPKLLTLSGPNWYTQNLHCVPSTPFFSAVNELNRILSSWQPENNDLVLVGGESHNGKSFMVEELLKKNDYYYKLCSMTDLKSNDVVTDTLENISKLSGSKKKAVIADDLHAGDSKGRVHELLPLLDKKHHTYRDIFPNRECLIVCTFSEEILDDVRNRSKPELQISVPGINEHLQDIPGIVASILHKAGYAGISKSALVALASAEWKYLDQVIDSTKKACAKGMRTGILHHDNLPASLQIPRWSFWDNEFYSIVP